MVFHKGDVNFTQIKFTQFRMHHTQKHLCENVCIDHLSIESKMKPLKAPQSKRCPIYSTRIFKIVCKRKRFDKWLENK